MQATRNLRSKRASLTDLHALADLLTEFSMASARKIYLLATTRGTAPIPSNSAFKLDTIAETVLQISGGGFDNDKHDDNYIFFTTSTEHGSVFHL